jgi:hypothetical protein
MDPKQAAAVQAMIEARIGAQNFLALRVYAHLLLTLGVAQPSIYPLKLEAGE